MRVQNESTFSFDPLSICSRLALDVPSIRNAAKGRQGTITAAPQSARALVARDTMVWWIGYLDGSTLGFQLQVMWPSYLSKRGEQWPARRESRTVVQVGGLNRLRLVVRGMFLLLSSGSTLLIMLVSVPVSVEENPLWR